MKPRAYQSRALSELWDWFVATPNGEPIVEACVGAGKSLMIALLCQRAIREYPGTRILVLVHQKELLTQNLEKLRAVWPQADVGVYSAALKRRNLGCTLTYATIGSIYKHAAKLGRIDLILADECHLIPTTDSGMWRKLIGEVRRLNPMMRVIGWSGTAFRGNGVWLTAGKDALFTHVATRVTMTELLELGYLAPLVTERTDVQIDTSGVRTQAGDYVVDALAKATDTTELVEATCDEICRRAANRKRWLVYCVTIEHAGHVCAALQARGIAAAVVTADTPVGERDATVAALRSGKLRALVNVAVFTTGFDVPAVDCIALLRATQSPVLYVQIAGRGMRVLGADIVESTRNGKADCLWLDFTSTTVDQGPVDQVKGRLPSTKGLGEAPFKLCGNCGTRNAAGASKCSACGMAFPEPERIKHTDTASVAAVLSSQVPQKVEREVTDVQYYVHHKDGSVVPTLRVEYECGIVTVGKEFICLGHTGRARMMAEQWWKQRSKIENIPRNAEAAMEWIAYDKNILKVPSHVVTMKDGKYDSIVGFKWSEQNGA